MEGELGHALGALPHEDLALVAGDACGRGGQGGSAHMLIGPGPLRSPRIFCDDDNDDDEDVDVNVNVDIVDDDDDDVEDDDDDDNDDNDAAADDDDDDDDSCYAYTHLTLRL